MSPQVSSNQEKCSIQHFMVLDSDNSIYLPSFSKTRTTGFLSSFLDNAPTYLTFAATACGKLGVSVAGQKYLAEFLAKGGTQAVELLVAISCGAVFMGANTYIGNGPNFMVKAIAEENKVKMPSFFGYMAWSGAILIPIFVVVTLVFF
jgi:Na+/H+ antiporter NhaD/arsenite permease-like protein